MHWIDPDCLLPVTSRIARFLFNDKGDADGLLMASGIEAHFPPHLSRKVLKAFQQGDEVTLYGVKPRGVEMIACVALEGPAGKRILDDGPPAKAKKKGAKRKDHDRDDEDVERVQLKDEIERLLHGPRGEVRGLLLASGDIARFPAHAVAQSESLLRPGARIALKGVARTVRGSRVIEVRAWGRSEATLKPVSDHRP